MVLELVRLEEDRVRPWTFEETKAFELALAQHFNDVDKWVKIAAILPQKGIIEIQRHFRLLEEDLENIQAGKQMLPTMHIECPKRVVATKMKAVSETKSSGSGSSVENRKGVSWTAEEHRLFLLGLAQFGKGNWRSIANEAVLTRTPTQVASHAQKYFLRLALSKDKREKRRASIHDMTHESEDFSLEAEGQRMGKPGMRVPLKKIQRVGGR